MEVEVCISAASVLVHIQSVDLFFLGYAKSDGLFQDEEQDERQDQGLCRNCYKTDQLGDKAASLTKNTGE